MAHPRRIRKGEPDPGLDGEGGPRAFAVRLAEPHARVRSKLAAMSHVRRRIAPARELGSTVGARHIDDRAGGFHRRDSREQGVAMSEVVTKAKPSPFLLRHLRHAQIDLRGRRNRKAKPEGLERRGQHTHGRIALGPK